MKLTGFHLEKMYFDSIDDEGNCFIVYWASLRFSLIKFTYSGLIFSNAQDTTLEKSSLRRIPRPEVADALHFDNPALKIKGSWQRQDTPVSLTLYSDHRGRSLTWNCHHPKAQTVIAYQGRTFQGWGYAETLKLPVKPWQLPIDELRWGRFLSENATITWIHWQGKHPVNQLIYNGAIYEDAVFEDERVVFDRGSAVLHFQETSVVRTGKLSGVLAKMPWLKIIFNSRILNTVEMKYKARSSFARNSTEAATGWSLFEVVTWAN